MSFACGCSTPRPNAVASDGTTVHEPVPASPAALEGDRTMQDQADPLAALSDDAPPRTSIDDETITPDLAPVPPAQDRPARPAPPPRLNGKTFDTAVIDDSGRLRRIEIRLRDGVAETRVDRKLVPADRVLVHKRGFVEIMSETGHAELSFNLPRGMTSVTQTGR